MPTIVKIGAMFSTDISLEAIIYNFLLKSNVKFFIISFLPIMLIFFDSRFNKVKPSILIV